MKKILFIIIVLISNSSCDLYNYEDESPYQTENNYEDENYLSLYSDYSPRGVLDNEINLIINELVDSKWILTKFKKLNNLPYEYPNDTISFISNNTYQINNSGISYQYNLNDGAVGSTNKILTLQFFSPFGGSHYSGQIGQYFDITWEINAAIFTDLQSSLQFKAYFIRIE